MRTFFTNQFSENTGGGAAGPIPTVPQPQGNLGFPINQPVPPLVSSPNQPAPPLVSPAPPTAPASGYQNTGAISKTSTPGNGVTKK